MELSNFKSKKIMVDDGSDFPVEFYIELYKRYPLEPNFWMQTTENFILKNGIYYDELDTEFTCQEIHYGCYCLYRVYDSVDHSGIDIDIYFIDKMEGTKYTSKNPGNYVSDPRCIALCEELGYDYIHEVPAYIDSLVYRKKCNKYIATIDKDKIINNLLGVIRDIKNYGMIDHYATIALLEDDLNIEDLTTNIFHS